MSLSLRRRLTVILVGLTLLTWFVSVLVTAVHARQMMMNQIDQHLTHYADMAQHSLEAVVVDPVVRRHFEARTATLASDSELRRVASFSRTENGNAINLWFGNTQVLVGESAPIFPEPRAEGIVTRQLEDGAQWRILYRRSAELNIWQAVGIDLESAWQGGIATFWRGVLPLLIILPVTVIILLFGIRRGLRPLSELAKQISARKPHGLEPFDTTRVPLELQPIVVSLNDLLMSLQRALISEQRFTANAAHELQTPLAAIQAAVQSCQRQLEGRPDCRNVEQMLERISRRVTSAGEMVKQLLTLARLDPDQEFAREPVEIGRLASEVMADVGGLAMERQLTVRFEDRSEVWVNGNAEWLRILLRNLFVNAFKYGPSGSEVEVVLERRAGYSRLSVANDCEPIPESEFLRLPERFYQPANYAGHGVGLGLSIVERIAKLHDAELHLAPRREGRGFAAELRFPDGGSDGASAES